MACARILLSVAVPAAGLASPPPVLAQPPAPASLEARVRALEARVAALEGRAAPAAAAATGPACRRLNVNASRVPPAAALTVSVNGTPVATYDGNAYGDLEPFMRKGPNTIALAFAAAPPAGAGTEAELRCLPPGVDSSRTTLLSLRPAAGRLKAEAVVVLAGP